MIHSRYDILDGMVVTSRWGPLNLGRQRGDIKFGVIFMRWRAVDTEKYRRLVFKASNSAGINGIFMMGGPWLTLELAAVNAERSA